MNKPLLVFILLISSLPSFAQPESAFDLGKKQYQEENYTGALKYFTQAANETPGNPQVPYFTGRVYLDMSNYKQAAAFLEKAIAMDSSHANWIYECGLVFYAIPDYKKSLQYIELAGLKGYKKTSDYQENLANAYVNTAQYDKAINVFSDVLKKSPPTRSCCTSLLRRISKRQNTRKLLTPGISS